MNICLLFSVCAPIGFDRSRKVAGFERSRVYRWKKSVKCSLEQQTLTRERQKCVWPHFWQVVSEDPGEDWILHQIIVRSPSDCVQVHQILKVTNFPFLEDDKMKRHGKNREIQFLRMNSTLIHSFSTSVSNKCHVFTCHFRITAFSTTEVFLKHKRENEHMSEADHWAGPTNTFFWCRLPGNHFWNSNTGAEEQQRKCRWVFLKKNL